MKELTLAKLSIICLLIQTTIANVTFNESVDFLGDHISIVSFIIILVANWNKVKAQVKKWIK
jgi:hypothetical protein